MSASLQFLFPNESVSRKGKRKSPDGIATSNVMVSAHVTRNADLFPQILKLHVPDGAIIADVTWGKGVFWQQVPNDLYIVHASDLQTGVDCCDLPYENNSHDCVVLDPPYMEGLFRRSRDHMAGAGNYAAFRNHYSNGKQTNGGPKYHAAVLDLYFRAGKEAHRVLRDEGILIVKCQDEVSANQQHLTHIEIVNEYAKMGFYAKDLFVLVRTNRPAMSRMLRQEHARKNHSYFIVFVKLAPGKSRRGVGRVQARKAAKAAKQWAQESSLETGDNPHARRQPAQGLQSQDHTHSNRGSQEPSLRGRRPECPKLDEKPQARRFNRRCQLASIPDIFNIQGRIRWQAGYRGRAFLS